MQGFQFRLQRPQLMAAELSMCSLSEHAPTQTWSSGHGAVGCCAPGIDQHLRGAEATGRCTGQGQDAAATWGKAFCRLGPPMYVRMQ